MCGSDDRKISYGQLGEFADGLVKEGFVKPPDLQYPIEHKSNMQLLASMFSTGQVLAPANGFEWVDDFRYHRQGALVLETGEHEVIDRGHWIIRGDARVKKVEKPAVIYELSGNAVLERLEDTILLDLCGNATLYDTLGHPYIRRIRENGKVVDLFASALVDSVEGNAEIEHLGGFASIRGARGDFEQCIHIGQVSNRGFLEVNGPATIDTVKHGIVQIGRGFHGETVEIGEVIGAGAVIEFLRNDGGLKVTTAAGTTEISVK
jgi:hypothetical protein